MDVLGANRLRRVVYLKRYCGFSTQARNGTCCRRASRTTKLCIGGRYEKQNIQRDDVRIVFGRLHSVDRAFTVEPDRC